MRDYLCISFVGFRAVVRVRATSRAQAEDLARAYLLDSAGEQVEVSVSPLDTLSYIKASSPRIWEKVE